MCAIMTYESSHFSKKVLGRLLIDREYLRYVDAVQRHDGHASFSMLRSPNIADWQAKWRWVPPVLNPFLQRVSISHTQEELLT